MIKLTGLILQNFLSFKYADVAFDDLGLCLIQGHNRDEDDSNGSGKTTIASAICWCLFGKTVKGIAADDVINWDAEKDCSVELTLEVDGKEIRIKRFRSFKDIGDAVDVGFIGGHHEGKPTEMQPMINQIIGFDYETFVNTTVYSQETSQMLGAATDSNRRKIFATLLNLDRFARSHEVAKAKVKELTEIQEKTLNNMELFKAKIEMLNEEIATHEEYAASFERNQKARLEQAQRELDKVPKKKRIKAIQRKYANLVDKLHETQAEKAEAEASEILIELRVEQKEKIKLSASLINLPDTCPTCNRKFTKGMKSEAEKDIMGHIEVCDNEIHKLSKLYDEKKKIIDALQPVKTEMIELEQQIGAIERDNQMIDMEVENSTKAIKAFEAQVNTHQDLAVKARQAVEMMQKDYDNAKADYEITNAIQVEWDFIAWLYGPKGAPTYIIENSFEYIQNQANYYLMILTGGTFEVKLEPEREIKGGKKKEEIYLRIFHNGKEMRYNNASDGQRQRINIALLFAINSYCRSQGNLDFLLLDEVLDLSLDETGQERVLALLREISREIGTIFVISHKKGIANNFDSVLNIIHENGESRVV